MEKLLKEERIVKKKISKLILAMSAIFMVFNVFWMLYQISEKTEVPIFLKESVTVNSNDRIYINGDTILTHNYLCGIFQCFNTQGEFLWGVHLPVTKNVDSTLVSYSNGKYYFWSYKTGTVYTQEKSSIVIKNERIDYEDEFYSLYPMDNVQQRGRLKLNGSINTYSNKTIQLQTSYNFYSFLHAVVGLFICCIIFILTKKYFGE